MKIKSLLIGMLACTALVGCSNEDEPVVNNGNQDKGGDAYVTVKLSMSGNAASRASFADNKFAEADPSEVKVTKATFYFLDENGQGCADKFTLENVSALNQWTDGTDNTNVDMESKAVVVIKNPITTPKSMVAILNVADPFGTNKRPSLAQIQAQLVEMSAANNATDGFIMTNSVFVDGSNVVVGAPIEAINIHKGNKELGVQDADANPVVIPVERVVAKVGMSLPTTGSTFDPNEGSQKYDINVSIDGWWLTNTSDKSYLVKNLATTYTTSPFDVNSSSKNWWTDAAKHRSYWATMPTTTYTNNGTWAAASATDAKLYCLENTDQAEANRTQYVAKATLKIKKEGANAYTAQTFVRWLNEIYTDYDFFQYIANAYNNYVIVSGTLNATEAIVYDLNGKVLVGAEGTPALTTSIFDWAINTVKTSIEGVENYEGQVVVKTPATGLTLAKVATAADGKKTYTTVEASKIQSDIRARINKVLLWLNGQTYYYTDIIHNASAEDLLEAESEGEETTGATIPLYGIIRNHLYNLSITGVQGMGTPAPNANLPIDPETPADDEYSHISAQIQILGYKVVPTQNVILGQ